jgi:hypothetical protein
MHIPLILPPFPAILTSWRIRMKTDSNCNYISLLCSSLKILGGSFSTNIPQLTLLIVIDLFNPK